MKYKPKRDLPLFALANKTTSPFELAGIILEQRNKKITPQAITNWFRRHPTVKAEIESTISKETLSKAIVTPQIFDNGTFYALPTIHSWVEEMRDRELSEKLSVKPIQLYY